MINFDKTGNYRGDLQAMEKDGKYYWRVDCDVSDQEWTEIPKYLYDSLHTFFHNPVI